MFTKSEKIPTTMTLAITMMTMILIQYFCSIVLLFSSQVTADLVRRRLIGEIMAVDSYDVIDAGHFDGHANLTDGQRSNGTGLSQIIRKLRAGRHTFTGAATETVTFGEAFDDESYTIVFGPTAVDVLPIYANKAADSFDITVAAAGTVDWIAIHD